TMWKSTEKMANAIAEGIRATLPDTKVVTICASENDKNDILVEVGRSKAILMGSPTINNGYSYAIAGMLEMIKGLKFKGKKAAAFGSYGWSGEAVKQISAALAAAGLEVVDDGLSLLWMPDEDAIARCRDYGQSFAAEI
ncbi:MAG: flavodoxin domain-containing protein, partial [Muribaculaceae bacterium]|nr:flavodoxin domain-containing protein [Muribaculaceae bacterium]